MKTPEEIRALDGAVLCRLAWEMGLAPKAVQTIGHRILAYVCALTAPLRPWAPHEDLAQAEAVLRGVRTRGWSTNVTWDALHGYGTCLVKTDTQWVCTVWSKAPAKDRVRCEPTEALALLRCAVLAVASQPT